MNWNKYIAVILILGLVLQAGGYVEWLHVHAEHTDHCDNADTETCPDSEDHSQHCDKTCTFCLQLQMARYQVIPEVPDDECFALTIMGEVGYFELDGDFDHRHLPFEAMGPPVTFSFL